jgi:hypothetical protein
MKITSFVVLTLLLCCAVPAYAENWDLLTRDKDTAVFVDKESVVRKGDVIEVWTMVDYTNAKPLKDQKFSSGRNLYSCDQRNKTITTLSTVLYSEKMGEGAVVGKFEAGEKTSPVSVAPKSIGERMMKYLFKDSSVKVTKNSRPTNRGALSSAKQYKDMQ